MEKRKKKKESKKTEEKYIWFKTVAIRLFGGIVDKYIKDFESLKTSLLQANIKVLYRSYLSMILLISLLCFIISVPTLFIVLSILGFDIILLIIYTISISIIITVVAFILGYLYPFSTVSSRRRSIETNMPFAINHMAAIAGSGVPPYTMFKLLTSFGEYGEISNEARKIVRNVDVFGQDIITALREIADRTPSKEFNELLRGIHAIIGTGGNLQLYLKQQADKSLFEYRLKREKYLEALSTYADFYTAVMIAAPLFLVAILAIMNMIGGQLWGMTIDDVMSLGIFLLIPIVNTAFIMFIHFTQPEL